MTLSLTVWLMLFSMALIAGFMDAIAGGGGLIQLPALLTLLPHETAVVLLGTSKIPSASGTTLAAIRYICNTKMPVKLLAWTMPVFIAFSFVGAHLAIHMPNEFLRLVILVMLIALAIYTFAKKDFGQIHKPNLGAMVEIPISCLVAVVLGTYEGFFGPGTGILLMFCYVRIFGFDFLSASGVSKVLNWSGNLAALFWFSTSGVILWKVGLVMALANMMGALIGTKYALRHGSTFVRKVFLVAILIMIVRLAADEREKIVHLVSVLSQMIASP